MKRRKIFFTGFLMIGLIAVFSSCKKDTPLTPETNTEYKPTPYTIQIPKGYWPTQLNIPADNPMTVEGIALGRYLFYDGRICGKTDTLMSCSTCHLQSHSFMNGIGYAHGVTGVKTSHKMLPMVNLVFNSNGYLWTGEVTPDNPFYHTSGTYGGNIEDVVWIAMTDIPEFASDTFKSKAAIQAIPMYPPMFKKAFGSDVVTFKNIAKAIAQFIRTLISSDSKYDKFLRGEVLLTQSERNGKDLFFGERADCYHCHGTILFTLNTFQNDAKDMVFTDPYDRYSYTHAPSDKGAYKVSTLRNISCVGPYMHDGRYDSLMQVINFYSDSLKWSPSVSTLMRYVLEGGPGLIQSEKNDLKAFLMTLTDSTFLNNPDFSKPADLH